MTKARYGRRKHKRNAKYTTDALTLSGVRNPLLFFFFFFFLFFLPPRPPKP